MLLLKMAFNQELHHGAYATVGMGHNAPASITKQSTISEHFESLDALWNGVSPLTRRRTEIKNDWGKHQIRPDSLLTMDGDKRSRIIPQAMRSTAYAITSELLEMSPDKAESAHFMKNLETTAIAIWYISRLNSRQGVQDTKGAVTRISAGSNEAIPPEKILSKQRDTNMMRPARDMNLGEIMAALIVEEVAFRHPKMKKSDIQLLQYKMGAALNQQKDSRPDRAIQHDISSKRLIETTTSLNALTPQQQYGVREIDRKILSTPNISEKLTSVVDIMCLVPESPAAFQHIDKMSAGKPLPQIRTIQIFDEDRHLQSIVVYTLWDASARPPLWQPIRRYSAPGFNRKTFLEPGAKCSSIKAPQQKQIAQKIPFEQDVQLIRSRDHKKYAVSAFE